MKLRRVFVFSFSFENFQPGVVLSPFFSSLFLALAIFNGGKEVRWMPTETKPNKGVSLFLWAKVPVICGCQLVEQMAARPNGQQEVITATRGPICDMVRRMKEHQVWREKRLRSDTNLACHGSCSARERWRREENNGGSSYERWS